MSMSISVPIFISISTYACNIELWNRSLAEKLASQPSVQALDLHRGMIMLDAEVRKAGPHEIRPRRPCLQDGGASSLGRVWLGLPMLPLFF